MTIVNRSIALDTETTGLRPDTGDRVIEIGAIELLNGIPSGETFHVYLDPERDVPEEAVKIHGITRKMLAGKPLFVDVADDFLKFISSDTLIIHNAPFDLGFLNSELKSVGRPMIKNKIVDTLRVARSKHPNTNCNLDALCRRYKIDNSNRQVHGALLDANLLAQVYLQLMGGPQNSISFSVPSAMRSKASVERAVRKRRPAQFVSNEEITRHAEFAKRHDLPDWVNEAEPSSMKI